MITAQDNTIIVSKVFKLFNERKLDEATQFVSADFEEINVATGESFKGIEGWKTSARAWIDAFPDARTEILNQFASDEYVTTEFMGKGTHRGPLATPHGPIPATDKKVEIHFCEVARLRNGKVSETRLYFDIGTMLRQLGLTP